MGSKKKKIEKFVEIVEKSKDLDFFGIKLREMLEYLCSQNGINQITSDCLRNRLDVFKKEYPNNLMRILQEKINMDYSRLDKCLMRIKKLSRCVYEDVAKTNYAKLKQIVEEGINEYFNPPKAPNNIKHEKYPSHPPIAPKDY